MCRLTLYGAVFAIMLHTISARTLHEDETPKIESAKEVQQGQAREPRLFFGTTTTATSTVSTFTVCYTTPVAAAVTAVCTGRRKRAIITDPLEELKALMPDLILPSAPSSQPEANTATASESVQGSQDQQEDLNQLDKLRLEYASKKAGGGVFRTPRIFYFYTSTTTSTTTTTTATTSITFTDCTPATSLFSVCG